MAEESAKKNYYISIDDVVHGPYKLDELSSKITRDTSVFIEDGVKWTKAGEIPELEGIFARPEVSAPIAGDLLKPEPVLSGETGTGLTAAEHESGTEVPTETSISVAEDLPTGTKDKSNRGVIIGAIVLLALSVLLLVYSFWIAPLIRDMQAPRRYCFIESLIARSSKIEKVDYNRIGTFNYGQEVVVYEDDGLWAKCKLDGTVCYVFSRYLLDKRDFQLLNSIFADADSRRAADRAMYRRALLNYFREKNLVGMMDTEVRDELLGKGANPEIWQFKASAPPQPGVANQSPNNIYIRPIVNPGAKYPDMACMIYNPASRKRRFLLFTFSENESPSLVDQQDTNEEGFILSVSKNYFFGKPNYKVYYTGSPNSDNSFGEGKISRDPDPAMAIPVPSSPDLSFYRRKMENYYQDLTNDSYNALLEHYSEVLDGYIDSKRISKYEVINLHRDYHNQYPFHSYELIDITPYDLINNSYLTTMRLSIRRTGYDAYKSYTVRDIFTFDSDGKIVDVKIVK